MSFTAAGLAGWMTFETGHRFAVLVEAWRTSLQTLSPPLHEDEFLSTAQTIPVATTPTLVARGVTSLTSHGGGVAKVTEKDGRCLL